MTVKIVTLHVQSHLLKAGRAILSLTNHVVATTKKTLSDFANDIKQDDVCM